MSKQFENQNSNWKKILGFTNMQEKLEKILFFKLKNILQILYNFILILTILFFNVLGAPSIAGSDGRVLYDWQESTIPMDVASYRSLPNH